MDKEYVIGKEKNITGLGMRYYRLLAGLSIPELTEELAKKDIFIDSANFGKIERQERGVADYIVKAVSDIVKQNVEKMYEDLTPEQILFIEENNRKRKPKSEK